MSLRFFARVIRMILVCWLLGLGGWMCGEGNAAAPVVRFLFPSGLNLGGEGVVTALGEFSSWPVEAWSSDQRVHFKALEEKGKFQVSVEDRGREGTALVWFFSDEGVSEAKIFSLGQISEQAETEPNDSYLQALAAVGTPVCWNGRLEKNGDVDSYSLELRAGQWLIGEVECYRLRSTADVICRILDSEGYVQSVFHDGPTLDPEFAWMAPRDGRYVVQVAGFAYPARADIRYFGGEGNVYRLKLFTGPVARLAWPSAVGGEKPEFFRIMGWNLEGKERVDWDELVWEGEDWGYVSWSEKEFRIARGVGMKVVEREWRNSGSGQAQELHLPCAVDGVLEVDGEEDRFPLILEKGQILSARVVAFEEGFPLDPWLNLEDAQGKSLKRSDDEGLSLDPALEWTASESGMVWLVVGDVSHRGGEDYFYRLEAEARSPEFTLSWPKASEVVQRGETVDIKIGIERKYGFEEEIRLNIAGLPEGVLAEEVQVAKDGKEGVITIRAEAGKSVWNGALQAHGTAVNSGQARTGKISMVETSVNNGVPGGYHRLLVSETPYFWLTVTPSPEEKAAEEKPAE